MSGMSFVTRFRLRGAQRGDLFARYSRYRDALCAAFFARDDSNSPNWHIQTLGEDAAERFVRAIFDGRRREPDFQRATMLTLNRIAARARDDAHREYDAAIALDDFDQGRGIKVWVDARRRAQCRGGFRWRLPRWRLRNRGSCPSTAPASCVRRGG